ncbi:MAG: DNA cytosine methyltransferase [Candidatus Pacebacteria bacterium]|nr:DNA cytosine methyltransferase [Candidatus Paceibacterota bacterium]
MRKALKIFHDLLKTNSFSRLDLRADEKTLAEATQRRMPASLSENIPKREEGRIQVLDFFSGCGGMSMGFHSLADLVPGSFNILAGVDLNEEASKSYTRNIKAPCFVRDIRKLAETKELERLLEEVGYDSGKPLVMIGCAPCQGFTSHRKKNWDKKDGRNDLALVFAEIAVRLKPSCIVMENVPEMFSTKYERYYLKVRKTLEKNGYIVHQKVYNTAAFGVPQERFRLLSMAMKKEFLLPVEHFDADKFRTVRDAIGNLPPITPGIPYLKDAYHICARHKPETIAVIKSVPKDGGNRPAGIGPKCLDRVKGFTDVYGRLHWNKPSITVTQYARNPASGRYVHPEQDRGLSIREAARLQGFPDEFAFAGKFDSMFKQIGEAVPPMFSCAVAANVLVGLLSAAPDREQRKVQRRYTLSPVSNSYASMIASVKNISNP